MNPNNQQQFSFHSRKKNTEQPHRKTDRKSAEKPDESPKNVPPLKNKNSARKRKKKVNKNISPQKEARSAKHKPPAQAKKTSRAGKKKHPKKASKSTPKKSDQPQKNAPANRPSKESADSRPNADPTLQGSASGKDHNHLPINERHGPLTDLIDRYFLEYASYVICERAIPKLEDGLKPVQRRILHALKEKDDGRFIKVANVVGHAMQYHPHGDASINAALITLANKGYLIEKQGNYGNLFTGDPAAAPRYIECRLTPLAKKELFNEHLSEFIPSYDGRNQEPTTLPSKIPLLLMLGTSGIAVGLSTRIMPHNFIELLEAEMKILQEKKNSPEKLNLLPDFPHGAQMDSEDYDNGNGRIKLRAKIENPSGKANSLIIREIPHTTTTESIMASIENAAQKNKVPVKEINDFTSDKVEIEIILTRGHEAETAIKALYAFTDCEVSISTQAIVIHNGKPVKMTVGNILRANTRLLLDILRRELELTQRNLQETRHSKTLVQIFIEQKIYQDIEKCATYKAVQKAVFAGLDPFRKKLDRDVTTEDVEMLLRIPIKRISRFDIDKNKRDLEKIVSELEETNKHLKHLKAYAKRYLKNLIKKYKEFHPRRTQIKSFKEVAVRKLTADELTLSLDNKNEYFGSSIKGTEKLECSSLDKVIIIQDDGTYQVMSPPEKLYLGDQLAYCFIFDRDQLMTCVYKLDKKTYIKRFTFGGAIMNRKYRYVPEDGKVLFLEPETPEQIYVKYKPKKNQRIHQQAFTPSELTIRTVKAKGKQMTSKNIQYIGSQKGRWWKDENEGPRGVLL